MQSWPAPPVPVLPGRPGPVRVRDSARGLVEVAPQDGTARLYVCGITPYDATHLGHAATYLAFDTLVRVWLDAGLTVEYVQNVTDIDDPLLERAARDGEDWTVVAERETALFREDMAALRVVPPTHYVGAVEAMDEISAHGAAAARGGRGLPGRRGRVLPGLGRAALRRRRRARARRDGRAVRRARRRPRPARQEGPAGPAAVARRAPGRARLGQPARARPAGLARRVHRDRRQPARAAPGRAGRRVRPGLPPPRAVRRPRRGAHRAVAVRRRVRARRDDRARRREDEQVARQPRVRVAACGRAAPTRAPCGSRCCPATTAPTGSGPTTCCATGRAAGRLAGRHRPRGRPGRARRCSRRCAPPSPTTSTPPPRWPPSTRGARPTATTTQAPDRVRTVVDALLGVAL